MNPSRAPAFEGLRISWGFAWAGFVSRGVVPRNPALAAICFRWDAGPGTKEISRLHEIGFEAPRRATGENAHWGAVPNRRSSCLNPRQEVPTLADFTPRFLETMRGRIDRGRAPWPRRRPSSVSISSHFCSKRSTVSPAKMFDARSITCMTRHERRSTTTLRYSTRS